MLGATLFGAYLAERYNLKEQQEIAAWALGMAAVLSLLALLLVPSIALQSDMRGEALRGVFLHKNILARHMALGALVFLFLSISQRKHLLVALPMLTVMIVLLVLSNARASQVAFCMVLCLLFAYVVLRLQPAIFIPVGIGFAISIVLYLACAMTPYEVVLGVLGRDVTLTGRIPLWIAVIEMIRLRPWAGYGYGGFWVGSSGESYWVLRSVGWDAPHAHNGLLDIWLDLGLAGVIVSTLLLFSTFFWALRYASLVRDLKAVWPSAYLSLVMIWNMSESTMLKQNIFWVMFVAIALTLRKVSYGWSSYHRH
jgi:O-antigen ligase